MFITMEKFSVPARLIFRHVREKLINYSSRNYAGDAPLEIIFESLKLKSQ